MKYLNDSNNTCFLFDLISYELFNKIKFFNSKRNYAIHSLLNNKDFESMQKEYLKLKEISNDGKNILKEFKKISTNKLDKYRR